MLSSKHRDLKREEIRNSILTSKEVLEILGFSRMRLSQIVNEERIIPIKSGLYLKDDILAFQEEREKNQ